LNLAEQQCFPVRLRQCVDRRLQPALHNGIEAFATLIARKLIGEFGLLRLNVPRPVLVDERIPSALREVVNISLIGNAPPEERAQLGKKRRQNRLWLGELRTGSRFSLTGTSTYSPRRLFRLGGLTQTIIRL
jgi:hypothetical protein